MAEWLATPIMEKLINTGFQYLEDQVRWQSGMKVDLERLRENHPKIQAVAHFASSQEQIRDQNPALNEWLWQLRDAIDEADDVLDDLEYMKLEKQLTKNKKQIKVRSIMKSISKRLVKIAKRALKIDPNLKRLEKVVQKLDKVSAGVATFFLLVKDAKQENQDQLLELYSARETGSLPKIDLIGRGEDKEYVMKWLRNPSNEYQSTLYNNISLLSIVGLGGMGKTTLLQHVYEDVKIEEFDLKMWVCVSNNFNVKQVIANMLNEGTCLGPLEALQRRLQSVVKSKKFLLVLDDIWDDDKEEQDKNKWENVLAPLAYGELGSKILMTTRMESVALMISEVMNKKNEILKLKGLNYDECLQLLLRSAFHGIEENIDAYHNLRSIAEKMIKKLSGSPLATKVMGGLLKSRLDERHWTTILNYDIACQNNILPILKLSYTSLPKVLQKCLSFCCTFPQDYQLDKDDIVQMWIALDFIQPSNINQGETLKDVGERYFDFLLKKSFLDKFQENGITYYKLHDILHKMVRAISAQKCFSIIDDEEFASTTPEIIQHLFVKTTNLGVLKNLEKLKNLRSLFLTDSFNDAVDFFGILTKIFKALRSIRLLVINTQNLKQIPEEIGHLKHLRYLKILNRTPPQLPRSLSNLYHLQFYFCYQSHIDNRLRLYIRYGYNPHSRFYPKKAFLGIHEVGKLSSLQKLYGFYVRNKVGYRIEELEHMNELRQLVIFFVEYMKDARDACSAKLCNKKNLKELSLVWLNNKHIDLFRHNNFNADEDVLDNLKPHSSLEKLKIDAFMGARSAIWMNEINLFSNLEYIKITNCWRWETLPPFWQLGVLKYLYLYNMPNVKGFDYKLYGNEKVRVFPSLQVLHIVQLDALEDWFVATAASYECLFPCLTELFLKDCQNLQELLALPPHLEKLRIENIGWKGCNWLQGIGNYGSISNQSCPDLFYP